MRTPPKLADPVIRRQDHVARRTEEPAPARRDPLVFPSGEPRHLAAGLGENLILPPLAALAKVFGVRPYYDRWDTRLSAPEQTQMS